MVFPLSVNFTCILHCELFIYYTYCKMCYVPTFLKRQTTCSLILLSIMLHTLACARYGSVVPVNARDPVKFQHQVCAIHAVYRVSYFECHVHE